MPMKNQSLSRLSRWKKGTMITIQLFVLLLLIITLLRWSLINDYDYKHNINDCPAIINIIASINLKSCPTIIIF